MISNTDMAVRHGLMVPIMLEFILIQRRRALVSTNGLTVTFTRVTGLITKFHLTTVIRKAASNGLMENSILENGKTI